ncbi:hypothetical protein NQ318_007339 [Aromia moschata]|uniref:DUF4817 domain-containing protein n=1 Tax=Aromia moschata TaxID=1265417 RepID=A0AAV8Z215_9CUCU|nr:hypothetical protein NQ318_007339 [Aromia moschata]
MIGYGDRARTQCEVVRLFRETHPALPPLNEGSISKIEAHYREMGHVRKVPSKRQAVVDDDTKLNLLLSLEENPITPARDGGDIKEIKRRSAGILLRVVYGQNGLDPLNTPVWIDTKSGRRVVVFVDKITEKIIVFFAIQLTWGTVCVKPTSAGYEKGQIHVKRHAERGGFVVDCHPGDLHETVNVSLIYSHLKSN